MCLKNKTNENMIQESNCTEHTLYLPGVSQYSTTGATSGAGTGYPSGVHQSLDFCIMFLDRCLSFCPFSFGHCAVCPSSIYGF